MVLYPNKLPESERVCSGICKLAKKVSFLLFFTYFCRMTSRKVIIEKTKDILNIKMDNKRAA